MTRALLFMMSGLLLTYRCFGQTVTDTGHHTIQIKEVIIKAKTYNYQQDSAANRAVYRKVFNTAGQHAEVKPNNKYDSGLVVHGLLSDLFYAISSKKKRAKQLRATILANETDHILRDSRYTPDLTSRVTHLTGDTLAYFMNAYPVSVDYVHSASELEFMMWIRDNYKEWVAKGRPMPNIAIDTMQLKR